MGAQIKIISLAGLANGKHHHNGDLAHLAASKLAGSTSLSNGSLNNNAHGAGELDYMEKMQDIADMEAEKVSASSKRSSKAAVGQQTRDASRKGRATSNSKDELITKMESDNKKLKVDLQLSRNKENDLRDQIVSYMTSKFKIVTNHDFIKNWKLYR